MSRIFIYSEWFFSCFEKIYFYKETIMNINNITEKEYSKKGIRSEVSWEASVSALRLNEIKTISLFSSYCLIKMWIDLSARAVFIVQNEFDVF